MPDACWAKPKILIVEDSPQNIRILMELLQKDFTIITAINGEKALSLAHREPFPELILLDILLPGIDGYEVCRRLKADPQTKNIPVIFVTAVSETMDETKAFQLGGVDYITKPYHPPTVKARMQTHLELKRYREQLEEMVRIRTAELDKAKTVAEAANEAKGRFISTMSHELQTPMNGIIAAADLALSYNLPDQLQQIIQTIKKSGASLTNVFSNIIEYSKAREGTLEIRPEPFQLDQLLKALPRTVIQKGVEKGIDLFFESRAAMIPNDLIGDKAHLGEIFKLLLDNAAKFNDQSPEVTIGVDIADQVEEKIRLRFSVQDNGIGIPPHHYDTIFNAFFQIDSSSIRHFDGLGLGLSICKRLIQLMGGDIRLESGPGQGSIFYFTVQLGVQDSSCPFQLGGSLRSSKEACNNTAGHTSENQLDLAAIQPALTSLIEALLEMNPEKVGQCLEAVKPSLPQSTSETLERLVKEYEYEQALSKLKALMERSADV